MYKKNPHKKALFLDRDGVINIDKGYVYKIEDCEFVEGIFDICRLAKKNDFILIVVTNQAGIGRGYYTEEDFLNFMDFIKMEFIKQGCPLDDVYYCPYYEDGLPPWNIKSFDRKPAPGMLLKAAAQHELDLEQCLMLGDRESDMEAGRNAGIPCNFRMDSPEDRAQLIRALSQNDKHGAEKSQAMKNL